MAAALQVGFGRFEVRLLDKTRYPAHARRQLVGGFDITVSGFGPVRRHAEGNEPAVLSMARGRSHGGPEDLGPCDHMIGRHDQDEGRRIVFANGKRGKSDGGGGVPAGRFEDQVVGGYADRLQLTLNLLAVNAAGDHDRRRKAMLCIRAQGRCLDEAFCRNETEELLWRMFARQWPQPSARASGKNDGSDFSSGHCICLTAARYGG